MISEIRKTWKDGCNHPDDSYVASFECENEKFDLYVFSEIFSNRLSHRVCIRFGDEPSQYYSLGSLNMFIQGTRCNADRFMSDALEILLAKGNFSWVNANP
jgi:hypothetical protein